MAKTHNRPPKESHRDPDDFEGEEEGSFDDPAEHREIERSRFYGGLPATPEAYARAREQWYRLPGALVRASIDQIVGDPAPDVQQPPEHEQERSRGEGR